LVCERAETGGLARPAQWRTFHVRKKGCGSSPSRYGVAYQMSDQISWCVELAVKPGRLDNFQALTGEMVEAARREHGVLAYQRFVSADRKLVLVYERYADSAAALAHLRQFEKNFAKRFSEMAERTRFTVLGNPSDELRALLDGFGARYLKPFGDFAYWT
jgi:quinol monooxygenase YgiN